VAAIASGVAFVHASAQQRELEIRTFVEVRAHRDAVFADVAQVPSA
jgi:hypothetical protein